MINKIDIINLLKSIKMDKRKKYEVNWCKVKTEKAGKINNHNIYTPKGEKIPGIIWTRVYDGVEEAQYVILKMLVEI